MQGGKSLKNPMGPEDIPPRYVPLFEYTSLAVTGALTHHLQRRTDWNKPLPDNSKIPARGTQNC